jgi:hypothetical protein
MFDMRRDRDLSRISELVLVLKKIPPNQFSLESWLRGYPCKELREFHEGNRDGLLELEPKDIKNVIECGTVACAMGWAALYKPFSDLGFRFKVVRYFDYHKNYPVIFATLVYEESESWDAVSIFFHLTIEESFYLFDCNSYLDIEPSLVNVLSRIEAFLEG